MGFEVLGEVGRAAFKSTVVLAVVNVVKVKVVVNNRRLRSGGFCLVKRFLEEVLFCFIGALVHVFALAKLDKG